MNSIKVLELVQIPTGAIVILAFPDNEYPKIDMILKRDDSATWKIGGIGMPISSGMSNGYEHLNPPCLLFDCKLEVQTPGSILQKGDSLSKN